MRHKIVKANEMNEDIKKKRNKIKRKKVNKEKFK